MYLSKIYEKQDNVEKSIAILQDAKKVHAY